jgi:hypothetical protein
MSATFDEAVQGLALLAEIDAVPALEDEHVRWGLYEASVPDLSRHGLLQDAVRGEPVAPLASAVVVRALEVVPDEERARWVDLLPPGRLRHFAARRAAELRVLGDLAV